MNIRDNEDDFYVIPGATDLGVEEGIRNMLGEMKQYKDKLLDIRTGNSVPELGQIMGNRRKHLIPHPMCRPHMSSVRSNCGRIGRKRRTYRISQTNNKIGEQR